MNLWWTMFLVLATMLEDIVLSASVNFAHKDGQAISEYYNSSTPVSKTYLSELPDDIVLGCKELRAKRFISDGFCTSLKAIKEAVCAGQCMPIKEQNLPWWVEFTKYWARPKLREWRCVEAVTKRRKVQLMCQNGETRTYKIKVVKSCRCKAYEREPNRTEDPSARVIPKTEDEISAETKTNNDNTNNKNKNNKSKKRKGKKNRHKLDKKERKRLRRLRKNSQDAKMARRRSKSNVRDKNEQSKKHKTRVIVTNDSPLTDVTA